MPSRPLIPLLIALLLLSGCASYRANRPDVAVRVEAMVANHEYARALATIELVKPSHPEYRRMRAWRATIERKASNWEAGVVADTDALIAAGQWYNAGQRLNESIQKLPQSARLQVARTRYLRQREAYLASVDHELALARGLGLPAELAALEKMAAVDPEDRRLRELVEDRRAVLVSTRKKLLQCGRDALAAQATDRAIECLTLAQNISVDGESRELLASARAAREVRQSKTVAAAQKREQSDHERRLEQLDTAYRTALRNGDLGGARRSLNELLAVQPNASLRQERALLDARIELRVKRGLEDGRRLYTQGDFEGARTQWAEALRLDPENEELKSNIARADRVLKKLEKLSSDQQNTN